MVYGARVGPRARNPSIATRMSAPPVNSRQTLPLAAPWPAPGEQRALVMGILNVTPDSFSDGGQFASWEGALAHGRQLAQEGADIVDIGGESTRPGSEAVPENEEIRRVIPVIEGLRQAVPGIVMSIDTYRAETARRAILAGARIVNDVWGLMRDPAMAELVAQTGTGLVAMHNRREKDPALDIVSDIERSFEASLRLAERAGIVRARIALDPGIGFGKTFEQNLAAIRAIPRLKAFGAAIMLGVSRKSFLGMITGRPVTERLAPSIAANAFGLAAGANIIRVHDVAAHRDAGLVIAALGKAERNEA